YADDLTFSLPMDHQGPPRVGALLGSVRRIVEGEGFSIHPDKTAVARRGGRQKITGLVVNGDGSPRTPREFRRRLRAAIPSGAAGKPSPDGEGLSTLIGMAAYVYMSDPAQGEKCLEALRELDRAATVRTPAESSGL